MPMMPISCNCNACSWGAPAWYLFIQDFRSSERPLLNAMSINLFSLGPFHLWKLRVQHVLLQGSTHTKTK